MIAPELMGHVAIPYKWKEFLFHRGCSYNVQSILGSGLIAGGRESKQGRQTVFFAPLNPFGSNPDEEKLSGDLSNPRKVHYEGKWKTNQDAVYWINLARAQDKGLQFWQTRSHAIIVCSSVPADCIYKVISQRGEKALFERLSTPRLAPKIVLKSNWRSQEQQPDTLEGPTSAGIGKPLRGLQPSTSTVVLTPASIGKPLREGFDPTEEKEEPEFEVDHRIEGIAQDAILNDEERMGNIKEVVDKLKIGHQPKRKSNRFDQKESQHIYEQCNIELHELGQISGTVQCNSCLKHLPLIFCECGTCLRPDLGLTEKLSRNI